MISKINSASIVGLEAVPVEVESDISNGLPNFLIVGLPDKSVEEAKERVRSAVKNSNAVFPTKRITVNLAPADLRKEGSSFDLPVAVSIMAASGQIKVDDGDLFIGELALDGMLRKVNGILSIVIMARERGFKNIFLPLENEKEASAVEGVKIFPIKNLEELMMGLRGDINLRKVESNLDIKDFLNNEEDIQSDLDFSLVSGQEHAKRALEIAASGGHNVLMIGPPGTGKTLLAKAFTTILPKMTFEEMLEISRIYSVSGFLEPNKPLLTKRPFRNPHHTASRIALVGGGQRPKPGEISLAHRGVLFLDEFSEFPKAVLEVLRQPLEDGKITISRASASLTYPSVFILIAASNPCPCGYLGDESKECVCSNSQIINYSKKISGPIMDRIDIHIRVPRVKYDKLRDNRSAESSFMIRERVEKARDIQVSRFANKKITSNAEMGVREIKDFCIVDSDTESILKQAVDNLSISVRGYHKILKLARTIADLENEDNIKQYHVTEAIQYRQAS
ncbi:magnesium chelatase [bacterium CG_4_10_14_0_2_um_filter_33_32]|nr:MAG: hypothetical protein AUJ93_00390 [bacterium CG2_30_33_46]PIR67779.1 MAG: magnesium chelatase [bacterium CG10_big_fil_rev_8_21_14_0_10_33_18]PIU76805.1 MAG: magnesium chelatase [bacterium CG06_land_8_20_14_3_00_33_50]PIW81605.1 MAG: magnesium chelatase [bacterium CG_4_8_14_3_um_filter_33_28]PIY85537.1 MAG: magnesium chelatase [bacterium CG_4_10_14_0_8_um_filter_33_57]PIZ85516.1 MAG: magnesium chelatase [bacterium CG_4_10_14_0_2_um_filter_33_32]PJA72355.1 MAG: magnesium chelatase [bacte